MGERLQRIFTLMEGYGISPNALARIAGINESQMRQYKAGLRTPSDKTTEVVLGKLKHFAEELVSESKL